MRKDIIFYEHTSVLNKWELSVFSAVSQVGRGQEGKTTQLSDCFSIVICSSGAVCFVEELKILIGKKFFCKNVNIFVVVSHIV